jgi:predicted enzyme related to lactoylglutathione lyase
MTSRIYTVTVDCADPARLAEFWSAVLGWRIDDDGSEDEISIEPEDDLDTALLFLRVPEGKAGKNRIHFDLAPDDQDAEVARLEKLGASRIDIGQGEESWVVMGDPEGNEFCVLTPR